MAFLRNVFGRSAKKEKREYPHIRLGDDPEANWEIVGELGDGAFGKVYKAKHRQTGKFAAAKIVELSNDDELEEFAVEIDILVECAGSKVVIELHEAYLFNNKLWMLIEFCAGGAMDDVLQELNHGLSELQMKVVTRHLFEALAALHEKHIIHRDLKAGNLLLCSDGMVKLADFGVSALNKTAEQKRDSFIGTPFWMAPEVIACETNKDIPYSFAADIWSAGVTMIELADMNPPHSEMHPMRVLFKIPKADPPTVEEPSKWSAEFNNFVAKCVLKDPAGRPTAREMLQHPFLSGSDSVTPMKVLFAEVRADVEESITELRAADTISTMDDEDIPSRGVTPCTSAATLSQGPSSIEMGSPKNDYDTLKSNCSTSRDFKTLRRVRKFTVDGQEYTTSSEVIIDVNKEKNRNQEGHKLLQAHRKQELREMKVLQREEVKETQALFQMIQKEKDDQERRSETQRQELDRRCDGVLEALAKQQRKDIERFEKKLREEFSQQAKQLKSQQAESLKKYKKDSKAQEKIDERNMATEIELTRMAKADRKTEFKKWKEGAVKASHEKEIQFEQSQQNEFEASCESWITASQNGLRDLEFELLAKRHETIQYREIDFWEMEQNHFRDHYQLSKDQLKEAFGLQSHQMSERHRKEVDQHSRRAVIKSDIMQRTHALEMKTLPQTLKKQKAAALSEVRKQLRKSGASRQEEKQALRQYENTVNAQQKTELNQNLDRHKAESVGHETSSEQALNEMKSLQAEKLDILVLREEEKLKDHERSFHAQVKEYNARLQARKEELVSEFSTQRSLLGRYYELGSPRCLGSPKS